MTFSRWRIALTGAAMLAIAATLAAQTHSGNVQGRLIDEHGAPIAGRDRDAPRTGGAATVERRRQGRFRFVQVPPGAYSVTADAPGFAALTREPVLVSIGRLTVVEIPLLVSDVNEALTVRGESPLIDPGQCRDRARPSPVSS